MPDIECLVSVIMGSGSDWPLVRKAVDLLKDFGVKYDVRVMSAHRTPDAVREYVRLSKESNIKVFICAAGKAAHLAGVVASYTTRPVIGIPIKSTSLNGVDALLSTVQMPAGVPVAAVAIDGAENAAVLAVQILAVYYPELAIKLRAYRRVTAEAVEAANDKIRASITEEEE